MNPWTHFDGRGHPSATLEPRHFDPTCLFIQLPLFHSKGNRRYVHSHQPIRT
jgi:hypothetical protein